MRARLYGMYAYSNCLGKLSKHVTMGTMLTTATLHMRQYFCFKILDRWSFTVQLQQLIIGYATFVTL